MRWSGRISTESVSRDYAEKATASDYDGKCARESDNDAKGE